MCRWGLGDARTKALRPCITVKLWLQNASKLLVEIASMGFTALLMGLSSVSPRTHPFANPWLRHGAWQRKRRFLFPVVERKMRMTTKAGFLFRIHQEMKGIVVCKNQLWRIFRPYHLKSRASQGLLGLSQWFHRLLALPAFQ